MVKQRETKETHGQRLSRLRKAKGLSLEEVHQRTKIHIGVLKNLEDDTLAAMAPAYVKGLLKIYYSFLGVDPKDFIEEPTKRDEEPTKKEEEYTKKEKEYTAVEPVKKEMPDSSEIDKQMQLIKPRINISVIKNKIKIKPTILAICLLVLAIAAFKFGKSISMYFEELRLKESSPETAVTKEKIPPSTQVTNKPILGIRATQDCWLEVKLDGKTVFKNVLKKGHFEFWEAKTRIEFSLGNAGGVEVEVNGRLLPPLGRRGQVIKNIAITKEGLRVPE